MEKAVALRKSVSMKMISELSGVSIATVSRVINNNGRFSAVTRDKVLALVKKYNYSPNIVAQGLRKNRIRNVGVIVPNITNEFFAKLALHIQKALFKANYSTLIYNTDENAVLEEKYLQALSAQSVSGIIFIAGSARENLKLAPAIPIIFLDRKPCIAGKHNYVRIETNHFKGGYIAGQCLINDGCKNLSIVMEKRSIHSQIDRFAGFKKALHEAGLEIEKEAIIKVEKANYDCAYQAVKKSLEAGFSYSGYFCTTDWLAIGAMAALLDKKVRIPQQAKIVGFDDISISEYSKIPLTTIRQNIKEMADLAAEIMIKMLDRETIKSYECFFDPFLIKRQTA
jgi:LacI family transcriptional regulator